MNKVGFHPMAETNSNADCLHMDNLKVTGGWHIIKGNLKQTWAQLTDDDLIYEDGTEEELLGRIQRRTGEAREIIVATIKEYQAAIAEQYKEVF